MFFIVACVGFLVECFCTSFRSNAFHGWMVVAQTAVHKWSARQRGSIEGSGQWIGTHHLLLHLTQSNCLFRDTSFHSSLMLRKNNKKIN